jgi:hypothetical protein
MSETFICGSMGGAPNRHIVKFINSHNEMFQAAPKTMETPEGSYSYWEVIWDREIHSFKDFSNFIQYDNSKSLCIHVRYISDMWGDLTPAEFSKMATEANVTKVIIATMPDDNTSLHFFEKMHANSLTTPYVFYESIDLLTETNREYNDEILPRLKEYASSYQFEYISINMIALLDGDDNEYNRLTEFFNLTPHVDFKERLATVKYDFIG